MKKAIIPIILGAFILFTFIAPNMTAETGRSDGGKSVSTKAEGSLPIKVPTTLVLLSTGLVGLIAITRKTRPKSK